MEFSVEQIASFLHGEIVGDGSIKVNNLSKIDDGKPGTLSFLANSKYTHHIYDTKASAVLVRRDFVAEQEVKTTLIKVDDPYACLALLLNMVDQATRPQKNGIEDNSYISDSATIGEDVYVGAFAYISYEAGFFDIFVYAFKKFGSSLWFVRPKEDSNFPRTYYDYKQSKVGQPKPFYQWMLWVGLALLVPAIVFSILYFINPITYY